AAFWAAGISDLFMLTPVCNALINIRRSCPVKAYSNSHAIGGRSARFGVRLVGGTNTGTRAIPIGIAPGELGAAPENLRRVIHPDQYNDQGTGGGQRGDGGALAQVQAYTRLPDLKQNGRYAGSDPYIPPGNSGLGHELVDGRKQDDRDAQGKYRIHHLQ